MARILGLDIRQRHIYGAFASISLRRVELIEYVDMAMPSPEEHQRLSQQIRAQAESEADPTSALEAADTQVTTHPPDAAATDAATQDHDEQGDDDADPEAIEVDDNDPLREAIEVFLGSLSPYPDHIIVHIDGRLASIRSVDIPAQAARRIADVLPYEVDALIPFDLEDVIIDHQLTRAHPIDEQVRVLAAAVPKEHIAKDLNRLANYGIAPHEMALGAASLDGLMAAIPTLQDQGPYAILELRDDHAHLCILADSHCVFAATLDTLIDPHNNDDLKRLEVCLRRSLMRYRSEGGEALERVFLAGDHAHNEALGTWIAGIVDCGVQILPMPPLPGASEHNRPAFAMAAALAARSAHRGHRFDMLKGEFAIKHGLDVARRYAASVAIAAGLVMASLLFMLYAKWSSLNNENEMLKEELATQSKQLFEQETRDVSRVESLISQKNLSTGPLPQFDAFDVIEALSKQIPAEIEHNTQRLDISIGSPQNPSSVSLEGNINTIAERDRIVTEIKAHQCFQKVEAGKTSSVPGSERLRYDFKASVSCKDKKAAPKGNNTAQRIEAVERRSS